jgi:aryl-alcohol dehydrogenase-like predicted oxidoreductase
MITRTLGSTGLEVSVIGIGTWQLGGEWGHDYSQSEADAILGTAEECGINLIDTAECYGDHTSERLVGAFTRRNRDRWVVATKFGHHFHGFGDRERRFAATDVLEQLEASLRALQTDCIDLYQMHSPTGEELQNDELWAMLFRQVEAGKIRHLGVSIGSNRRPGETEAAHLRGAQAIQVVYNRLSREPEEAILPACQRLGLGVLARVPLASGFLSGKYHPDVSFPANDVRSTRDRAKVERALAQVAEIQKTEVPAGVDLAQWALAWCLRQPAVTCVIPGCKNTTQVRHNAAAASLLQGA